MIQFGFIYPYLTPKIPFLSIFNLTYLYLPLFTYIWLYLGLITLIWAYVRLIALILPYVHIHPIYVFFYWDCTSLQNFRAIIPLFMEILHFKELGDTKCHHECGLGVNPVIDNFVYVVSDTSPLYKIWKQSDHYLWRYCILKIWGIQVPFGWERSCSNARRVSNFNSNIPQGGIYPHIKFERDP